MVEETPFFALTVMRTMTARLRCMDMFKQLNGTKRHRSVQRQPSAKQWQAFRKALDSLNVWGRQADYPDPRVCAGTNWDAEIAYADKEIKSSGDRLRR